MKRLHTTALSSLAALALLAGAAQAESVTNADTGASLDDAAIAAVQDMGLAQQLAAQGLESGDAILLIAAARIANQVAAVSNDDMVPRDPEMGSGEGSPGLHTAAEMLAAARELAGDRPDLIGLIEDAEAEGSRGSVYGSGYYDGYIDGGINLYYDEAFYGGEQAVVTLQGHNPSDIDLWIYDEYGNLICSSTGYSSNESCSWTPRWTGDFTIRVENEGHPQGTYFTLWTN
ncbi:MAG: hypothetical protein R3F55_04655 [Alphaproteobacteria bacterium]